MKYKDECIYRLEISDIYYVAQQEGYNELSEQEIRKVKDLLEKYINWYEALAYAIQDTKDQNFERTNLNHD